MRFLKQKIVLVIIPIIYLIIFVGLKSNFQHNLLALQNSIYPIAVLAFTVLVDALLTVAVLLLGSHLFVNIVSGIVFVTAIAIYKSFHAKLGLFCAPSELIFSMLFAYSAAYLIKYLLHRSNKRLVNTILGTYFSKKTRNEIISEFTACEPISKEVTILECTITDLDRLVENNTPKDIFAKANFVLNAVIDRIVKNGGRVDKFIGSKIFAYWENPEQSYLAVKAAIEAFEILNTTNSSPDVDIRIAIHHERVLLGLLGTSKVMNYSIISPVFDILEQIISNCVLYNKKVLITKSAYKQSWRNVSGIKVATLNLKGVGNSTELYEPLEVKQKVKPGGFEVKND